MAACLLLTTACEREKTRDELGRELINAALGGDTAEIKQLLDQGADINARDEREMTALHLAVENRHVMTLEFLLKNGADVNARDRDGWTPLHLATFLNDTRAMSMLLDGGASMDIRDRDGRNPLDIAALYQRKEAALLLLQRSGLGELANIVQQRLGN